MIPLSLIDLQILIAAVSFLLGCMCFLLGTGVLIRRGYSRELHALATSTARLGQKGVAEEITGLVNSASDLMASLNQMVKTASGVGLLLITIGLLMMTASYWIVIHIEWPR